MQTESPNARWTFARMVAELPSETRYELHQGVLLDMSPTPSPYHQDILGNLAFILKTFFLQNPIGKVFISPLDVLLAEDEVVQPDLFVVLGDSKRRLANPYRGVPDIAIEILSPTNIKRDTVEKKALYAQYGVKEYWIVDPKESSVEFLMLSDSSYLSYALGVGEGIIENKILTGLRLDLEEVFA